MLTAFELITFGRRDGNGRRGAIVLAGMLAVFAAFALFSSSSAYGAASSEPAAKKTPMVICRGRLDVVGTARNDTVALRPKAGDKSRLQVDVGGNGSAEFTFKRSALTGLSFTARPAPTCCRSTRAGVFTHSEATSLFGDAGNDALRSGSSAEHLLGGDDNVTIDGVEALVQRSSTLVPTSDPAL